MVLVKNYGWHVRDKSLRKHYKKHELKKNVIKSLLFFTKNPNLRLSLIKVFYNITKKSSISNYRTSCMFSGSGRSVFRKFKLSRHFIKYLASEGLLMGFRKSSF